MGVLSSSSRVPPAEHWLPAFVGYCVELSVLVLAVVVSLPPPVARVGGVATLGVGLVGGFVAGRLSPDPGAAYRNGVLVGVAGGPSAAVLLYGTMSLAIPRERWSAIWTIEYAIATGLGGVLPADVAARYDGAIAAGLALAFGGLVFGGSVIAALAAAPIDAESWNEG